MPLTSENITKAAKILNKAKQVGCQHKTLPAKNVMMDRITGRVISEQWNCGDCGADVTPAKTNSDSSESELKEAYERGFRNGYLELSEKLHDVLDEMANNSLEAYKATLREKIEDLHQDYSKNNRIKLAREVGYNEALKEVLTLID